MRYSFSVTRRQYARLPLILRSVGIDHDQDPILRPKGFPIWQIFFGVSGEGEFYADGARFVLYPGQLTVLPPHASHGYRSLGGTWVLHYIGFDGLLCQRMMAVLGLSEAGVYEPADGCGFLAHLQTLERMATSPDADPVQRSSALYALLFPLYRPLHFILAAAASLLVFSLLYTPCVAAIASIKREYGKKWAAAVIVWQCGVAWLAACAVHLIGTAAGM